MASVAIEYQKSMRSFSSRGSLRNESIFEPKISNLIVSPTVITDIKSPFLFYAFKPAPDVFLSFENNARI